MTSRQWDKVIWRTLIGALIGGAVMGDWVGCIAGGVLGLAMSAA